MHQTLCVLTLNLHKGFNTFNRKFVLHELREGIRKISADLVFLQEVIGEHQTYGSKWVGWPSSPQYEFLADQIWSDFAYGKNAVYTEGHHGNAILSKYPILEWQNVDVSMHTSERRGMLHCQIDVRGTVLNAICIHFGLLEKFRRQQLLLLKEYISSKVDKNEPVIVAGDFNDWRLRASQHFASELGFVEAFEHIKGQTAKTFPSFFPVLALDRIYVRNLKPIKSIQTSVREWWKLSDHKPLCVEFELQ